MRIFAAQLNQTIGDLEGNTERVLAALKRAHKAKVDIVLFPELTLSGYPPEDLLLDPSFIDAVAQKLQVIAPLTKGLFVAVGLPRRNPLKQEKFLYNSAAIFIDGKLHGFKDKTLLPTYDVFDERRFFEPGSSESIWEYKQKRIAVTICEDLWEHADAVGYTRYIADPVLHLKEKKVDLVLNLSASPYYFRRKNTRLSVCQAAARTLVCPVILCNQVGGNDQIVFDGHSLYVNPKGELVQMAKGFGEEDLIIDLEKKTVPHVLEESDMADLYHALVLGVRDYFHKQGFKKGVLGLSGGIDSSLTACIAVDALGKGNVLGLSLPTRYSSPDSVTDAQLLAKHLGIEIKKIDIDPMFQAYLHLLEPMFEGRPHDLTEENLQSRIRAMILMAFSNKFGSLLLTTGNKSELAMGYTTLYGDMAGGLAVLHDVTKLNVYKLGSYVNRDREIIPEAILTKAPSAELRPNQKTTDDIHSFEILDPVIEDYVENLLSPEEIAEKRDLPLAFVRDVTHRIHLAEYKRRQAPISIRVTQKAFSKGRNVPIVQKWM